MAHHRLRADIGLDQVPRRERRPERRGRSWARWCAASAALGLCLVASGAGVEPARAGAPADGEAAKPLAESLTGLARAEHATGTRRFADGDIAGALDRFEHAYALSRDHRLLWNIARCEKDLRRYARLLATLRRLEAEAGAALSAAERQDLADLSRVAEALVSRLDLTASEADATVFVDDAAVGTTPLEAPILVDIGKHRVRVSKPGFVDFVRETQAFGGDVIAIDAKLVRPSHRGRLLIAAGPDDLIALDGKVVGRGRWEGFVPSGTHALRVTAPHAQAYRAELLLRDDEVRRVQVALKPLSAPDDHRMWLWIGGGVALFAGAAIAGALLLQPATPAEQGSIATVPLSFSSREAR